MPVMDEYYQGPNERDHRKLIIRLLKALPWTSDSAEIAHEKMLDRAAVIYELIAFYSTHDEPITSLKRKAT